MSQKLLVLLFVFGSIFISQAASEITLEPKVYIKEYYKNGSLKAEGWAIGQMKTNYWTFYHKNGTIASKGVFQKQLQKWLLVFLYQERKTNQGRSF